MKRIESRSAQDTQQAGRELGHRLHAGDVVAFFGGLGMGKTLFIRGLAQGMNITDSVSSPTYALVHEYRGTLPLFHFDMYRVETYDDLLSTGFFEYLDRDGVCAVEWSENIENCLPDAAIRVNIERGGGDNTRIITITGKD